MKKRFFGLAVAAFALVFAAFAPAQAEAQTVKNTYWMYDLANADMEGQGFRGYLVVQFTDKQFTMGVVLCAQDESAEGVALANGLINQFYSKGTKVGEIFNARTIDYTQRGNTISYTDPDTGKANTMELSSNKLNLTVQSGVVASKVNLVAGKWPNIKDHPELMAK